jgi:hypothetical protein
LQQNLTRMKEPNFDDEQTLLTARPVVPLAKIDAKERSLRHWVLGGAFALAMMLGAASALLASYLKLRNAPNPALEANAATEVSDVETPGVPVAVAGEPVESDLSVTPETDALLEAPTSNTPKRVPVRRQAPVTRDTELVRPRTIRQIDDEDELERIREAVLIDAWEERRARRAARRERRNRVDHHDRDLSNLDEIFEGRRQRRP